MQYINNTSPVVIHQMFNTILPGYPYAIIPVTNPFLPLILPPAPPLQTSGFSAFLHPP